MTTQQQEILIITGMHRSGTSLTSSLLQSAGLNIGKNLLPANEFNPKGYFENTEFLNFHESLLYSLGIDKIGWTTNNNISVPEYYIDQARKLIEENQCFSQPWGWKEPRTTLFLDFWSNLLPEAKFLFIYRSPWEVLDSLYRRTDDIFTNNPEYALEVWKFYNQKIMDFYHDQPDKCLIVHINSIIKDPSWLIKTIENKLSIPLSEPDTSLCDLSLLKRQESQSQRPYIIKKHFPDAFQMYCDLNNIADYEDPLLAELEQLPSSNAWILKDWLDVKHIERQLKQEKQYNLNQVEKLYQELGETQTKVGELKYKLEQSQAESNQLRSDLEQSQAESNQLRSQLEQSQQELTQSNERIMAMETSKFWKIRKSWFKIKRTLGMKENE